MKYFISASLALALSGCHTLGEVVSPTDTSTGYRKTQNSSGETVYKRQRYVAPTYYVPAPTPPPVYVEVPPSYESYPDNNLVVRRADPIQLSDVPSAQRSESLSVPEPMTRDWAFGAEVSSDRKRTHMGLLLFKKFEWVELKGGISLFSADKDLYAGFDLGVRPYYEVVDNVSIFAGAGLYGGDTKRCSYDSMGIEECEKKFLYAGYVEAGVYLWNVSVFARSYNIEEAGKAIPSDTFFGVGLRTTY